MSERMDETEFMQELQAAERLKAPPGANLLLWAVLALIGLFFIWAAVSEVEVLTRGTGQVVPAKEIQVVQSLDGGLLEQLYVKEGDRVQAGETLMRMENVSFVSQERGAEARLRSLRAEKARLTAEISGQPLSIPESIAEADPQLAENQRNLYRARREELENALSIIEDRIAKTQSNLNEAEAQINRLTSNRNILQEELNLTRSLVESKAVPKIELIRMRRQMSDIRGALAAEQERRQGLQADLRAARKQREERLARYEAEVLSKLHETESEMSGLRENLRTASDRIQRTEIRSPVDGVVNVIHVKTLGGVIEPAKPLVEIVPVGDDLKVLARVRPNDIAFLEVGQKANVKITAYDPTRYGHLDGNLTRIGADSVKDQEGNTFFEIEVRTKEDHLGTDENPLPVTSGMVAQIEVVTGKRTILEYLMKPFTRGLDNAMTER